MFSRRTPPTDPVRIRFEGREIVAQRGDSVAAALLAAGVHYFRESPISGARRAPFCMIGNCYDCLLDIDGEPNCQGCMTEVREAMEVRMQRGVRAAGDVESP